MPAATIAAMLSGTSLRAASQSRAFLTSVGYIDATRLMISQWSNSILAPV